MAKVKSSAVSLSYHDGLLWLTSPYRPDLPPRLKALGGKWHPETKEWKFAVSAESSLRVLCKEFWGEELPTLPRDEFGRLKVGFSTVNVEKSHQNEAVTLATTLAALMKGMTEPEKVLIFEMLFGGDEDE